MVVEIVGPPGSGKSTLARELARQGMYLLPRSAWSYPISWRAGATGKVALPFASQLLHFPGRRWTRFKLMLQLEVLHRAAAHHAVASSRVVVMDQGPVYRLPILQRSLREGAGSNGGRFVAYWEDLLRRWASVLGAIVVLEADDDALYARIHRRNADHQIRRLGRTEAAEFFRKARVNRENMIRSLRQHGRDIAVLNVATDLEDVGRCASRIVADMRQLRPSSACRD